MPSVAASRLVSAPYSEELVKRTAVELRGALKGATPTLALAFISPAYVPYAADFLELVRLHGHVATVVGCTGRGLIGSATEEEEAQGFSLLLLSTPRGGTQTFSFQAEMVEEAVDPTYWHRASGLKPDQVKAWLVFSNPYQMPMDTWLKQWNQAYPGIPTLGGFASMHPTDNTAYVLHNGKLEEGAVALALQGDVEVRALVSQGCKPIGEPLTVTRADNNVLFTLGSKPAYEVLNGAFQALTEAEREHAKGHLFAGLAMNEYVEEFKRGDFLVRNILGADPQTGAVAISDRARIGQTLQYQLRDAAAASEDLHLLLTRTQKSLKKKVPAAGLLCTCLGRGTELFSAKNHDAGKIAEIFPALPLTGFFANSEIGPVAKHNYIHTYSASLVLFL